MLTKLAFKNVGKSLRDYAIYFFTLAFGVCVFYMFNSIYAQQEIMVVTETTNQSMIALREMLSYISVFVAVVLGFLIVYANNFFIKRRKKELGIYMTLGMEKKSISAILVMETSLMAVVALIVGLFGGVFLSQFMSVFTAKIFEADMVGFKFVFAPDAALKSVLYFSIIFLIVIVFNTFSISKFKLIDLLYGGRKNENQKIKNIWISFVIFVVSILCLVAAYIIILKNGIININIYFLLSIVLGTVGTVLFFFSLAGYLTKMVQSNKKIYFKNLNIFILRQLSSKINTNFVSISVVCIVLLLTIGIFSCGYSMQNVLSGDLKESVNYDFSLYNYSYDEKVEPIFENLPEEIKNYEGIEDYVEFNIYEMNTQRITLNDLNIDIDKELERFKDRSLKYISLSDYNKLQQILGMEELKLAQDNYAILSNYDLLDNTCDQLIQNKVPIKIDKKELFPVDHKEILHTSNNTDYLVFIVNDEILSNMDKVETNLNIQCRNDTCIKLEDMLTAYMEEINYSNMAFNYFISKNEVYQQSVTTKAIVSYLAIYLGIVFMITCAAILAIQQLSEAADNRDRYTLLKKLGVDKGMLNKALFTQIACYFLFPLILATIHSIVGLSAANDVIKKFGKMDVISSIIATALFVVVVYGTYFAITYAGSKNIINKG